MRETRIVMGMPVSVELPGEDAAALIEDSFAHFAAVERRFSVFRADSEITAINEGRLAPGEASAEMREVLAIARRTRQATAGYFDIRRPSGGLDPSGVVKGWAIAMAARRLRAAGARDFLVDAGGDIQCHGRAPDGTDWRIGIRHPFDETAIVKAVSPRGRGMATSGTYVRGQHIYDPHRPGEPITDIVSLTVIGPDVLQADLFATAAFAMGRDGIAFVERTPGLEGYLIDSEGYATETSGFRDYVTP
jgi:thiamine biosynthesis lipoprotein